MPDGSARCSFDGAVAMMHELMGRFASIGTTGEGGVSRLAASHEDGQARDVLCDWLRRNGFDLRVDATGNIFGIVDFGEQAGVEAVLCGSHLDSQPDGGRFDGTYGVVAGCCAALTVRELVRSNAIASRCRYLVVVNWTNEEGARFQPSLLGGLRLGRFLQPGFRIWRNL